MRASAHVPGQSLRAPLRRAPANLSKCAKTAMKSAGRRGEEEEEEEEELILLAYLDYKSKSRHAP